MENAASTVQLLKTGEGLALEFKRTISSAYKIAKTISAFSNTAGGVLLIGIHDDGSISGVQSELKELQKLQRAAELLEPQVILQVKTEVVDGCKIIRIEIGEGEDKPYSAVNERNDRVIYIRIKDKSTPVPKLLLRGQAEKADSKILASRPVKTLVQYLREFDHITAKELARMVNVSDKRAGRLLHDLEGMGVLTKILRNKAELFALRLRH